MNRLFQTLILSVLFSQTAMGQIGQVQYVRDTLYVALRTLPSADAEVVHSGLVSGTPLTVLAISDDGEYSMVRTEDDRDGWLQTQYLSELPAARDQLDRIMSSMNQDETEQVQLQESLDQLAAEHETTVAAMAELSELNAALQAELESVLAVSGNAIALNDANTELQSANQQLRNEMESQQLEIARLQNEVDDTAFWRGVLAVLIGMGITLLVALIWPKKKSEWA